MRQTPLLSRPTTGWAIPRLESLCDYLDHWSARQPDALLYSFLDIDGRELESYTYRELRRRVHGLAGYLADGVGLEPGERALLVYPPGLELIVASLACLQAGVIPVPVCPPSAMNLEGGLAKVAFIVRDSGARAALTTQAYRRGFRLLMARRKLARLWRGGTELPELAWVTTDDAPEQADTAAPGTPAPTAFLQYTSGSTSDPRGVVVTHRNLIHNCAAVVDHCPTGVSWLPQFHDMGFIGYYLFPLIAGGATYGFSPMDFLRRPRLWLETIGRVGATMTSAPNFAYEYCLREDKVPAASLAEIDLSSLRVMMTAAEPVSAQSFVGFRERFSRTGLRGEALMVAYGLAENTLAVSSHGKNVLILNKRQLQRRVLRLERAERPSNNQLQVVSCGRPLAGQRVAIVDPDSRVELGEDRIGEIWIDGDSKCAGYWQRPALSREVFRARLAGLGGGGDGRTYLRTGDLGFLHECELYVCGRIKDLIIIRGVNYYPQDVESIVEAASPRIRKGCVAAFSVAEDGEALVVVAEVKSPRSMPDAGAIARAIRTQYYIEPHQIDFIPARTLPKTTSGKVRRGRCRQLWLEGELPVMASHHTAPEPAAQAPRLADRFRHITDLYDLTGRENLTFAEVGMDSLAMVELVVSLRELLREHDAAAATEAIDTRLLERLTVADLYSFLDRLERAPAAAIKRMRHRLGEDRDEQQANEQASMRVDSELTLVDPVLGPPRGPVTDLLLTGATGFFGPFLLASLLQQTSYRVQVLIRATDAGHGMDRIRAALGRARLWTPELDRELGVRVRVLCGDLASPRVGLRRDQWESLAHGVQAICHNGALVNYVLGYDSLRPANVDGTRELLRLAASGRRKSFHLISSTCIFGWTTQARLRETDQNEEMANLDFGYAQTKWVAERLVRAAGKLGLDVRIYRPSLLSASTTRFGSTEDIAVRLLAFMIRHGLGVNALNQVSFLPVDVAAHNLVSILASPRPTGETLHLTADRYYSFRDVTDLIHELHGYRFRYLEIPDFLDEMNRRCTSDDPVYPLLDFFNHSYRKIAAMQGKRYDNLHYRQARERLERSREEPPLERTVSLIVESMLRQRLIPEPPRRASVRAAAPLPPMRPAGHEDPLAG